MILLDASVLFEFQRAKDAKVVALVPNLPCWLCGATRSEALQGARTASERTAAIRLINSFRTIATPEAVWDEFGDNRAALRRAGLVIPHLDVLIATVGIHHAFNVWARATTSR